MKLRDTLEGTVVVMRLSGKITGHDHDAITFFHGKVQEYLNQKRINFVIDFEGVPMMTSIGIGMLVRCLAAVNAVGGRVVLSRIENVEKIINITQLLKIFQAYDTTNDAIRSYES